MVRGVEDIQICRQKEVERGMSVLGPNQIRDYSYYIGQDSGYINGCGGLKGWGPI